MPQEDKKPLRRGALYWRQIHSGFLGYGRPLRSKWRPLRATFRKRPSKGSAENAATSKYTAEDFATARNSGANCSSSSCSGACRASSCFTIHQLQSKCLERYSAWQHQECSQSDHSSYFAKPQRLGPSRPCNTSSTTTILQNYRSLSRRPCESLPRAQRTPAERSISRASIRSCSAPSKRSI